MLVDLINVKKIYEETTVLSVDRLTVVPGDFYGIIGANGAGKTTMLRLIAGLDAPSVGQITYGIKEHQREITLVFQKPYLLRTTVEKNIGYPLKLRGWERESIAARVLELAEDLGLSHLLHRKAWTLSAGETQKVALARSLSFRPALLLLDEPTSNLDPKTTAELEDMLRKTNQKEGTSILLITHNLAQARRISKHIIFLHKGEILERGPTKKVLAVPDHPMTKKFVEGELLV